MNAALYYPYLSPPSKWLRIAALCWDKVYTFTSPDSPDLDEDVVEFDEQLGGFISRIDTRVFGTRPEVLDTFERLLDSDEGKAQFGDLRPLGSDHETQAVFGIFPGKLPGGVITEKLAAHALAEGS